MKGFYETGITFNNNIALKGGNKKTLFRLSYANYFQSGTTQNEYDLNKENVEAAVSRQGEDAMETRIWWDK